jgi:hypothetical protein
MSEPGTTKDQLSELRALLREVIEEDDRSFFMGENWRARADKVLANNLCTSAAAQESKA